MKKIVFNIIKIVLCASLLIFSSCSEFCKSPPKYIDLGDDYWYLIEYGEIDVTRFPGDGIWYKETPIIMPKIEVYKYNDNYITIKQKYHKKNSSKLLEWRLYYNRYQKNDPDVLPVYDSIMIYNFNEYYVYSTSMRSEAFCDSVVNTNPYFTEHEKNEYNYYIIEKHDVVKHGPLSRKEFEAKFKEMNLTSELWIDDIPTKKRMKK